MFLLFNKFGGYVKSVGASKVWGKLSEEEKELAREAFAKSFYPEEINKDTVDGKTQKVKTDLSLSDFLFKTASKLTSQKHHMLAEKLLTEASNKEKDSEKKHIILTELIDVFYKQRMEREDAIDKCIHFCKKDMELAPKIIDKKKDIPSFKRLAIIFENEKKYNDAIQVSEMALKYGLNDGTKGGYEGRIEKLKTKLTS